MSTDDKKDKTPKKVGKETTVKNETPAVKPAEAAVETATSLPADWVAYITPFATAIGKPVDEVTVGLKELVGEPGEEAVSLLQDISFTPNADIVAAVGDGVPKAKLTKAMSGLRETPAVETVDTPVATAASLDVLPNVPSDDDWLASLQTGGVLKFNTATISGTVSVACANKAGLFEVMLKLKAAMDKHTKSLREPASADYYEIEDLLTRRDYSAIFSAMPKINGRFATKARKAELLQRVDENLWDSLSSYHNRVTQWVEAANQSSNNPAALANVVNRAIGVAGGVDGALPPTMVMAPPVADTLRDAADAVIDDINYILAGTGGPVAMALAYDAQQTVTILENTSLPAQVGSSNREQMLNDLGVSVSSDYRRMEKNVKQYALAVVNLQNVSSGQTELNYIGALYQLGTQIPWDKLNSNHESSSSGIGGSSKQL